MPPICWAVALGCTTAARLAQEWSVTKAQAAILLREAQKVGFIQRVSKGVYFRRIPGGRITGRQSA